MHQIQFRLGLHPRFRWGSSQPSPSPPIWIQGVLLLREKKRKKKRTKGGKEKGGARKGREEGEGQGGYSAPLG